MLFLTLPLHRFLNNAAFEILDIMTEGIRDSELTLIDINKTQSYHMYIKTKDIVDILNTAQYIRDIQSGQTRNDKRKRCN